MMHFCRQTCGLCHYGDRYLAHSTIKNKHNPSRYAWSIGVCALICVRQLHARKENVPLVQFVRRAHTTVTSYGLAPVVACSGLRAVSSSAHHCTYCNVDYVIRHHLNFNLNELTIINLAARSLDSQNTRSNFIALLPDWEHPFAIHINVRAFCAALYTLATTSPVARLSNMSLATRPATMLAFFSSVHIPSFQDLLASCLRPTANFQQHYGKFGALYYAIKQSRFIRVAPKLYMVYVYPVSK